MSFFIKPYSTIKLLKKIGFKNIFFVSTRKKYLAGYKKSLKYNNISKIRKLGMHVIGGSTMFER